MKTIKSILILSLLSGILSAQTAEETIGIIGNESGFGIRAAGMGNAYTGVANDYSAIYWNPAGLAQIEFGNLSASLQHNDIENSVDYFSTNTTDNRTFTKLQSFGLAYSFPVVRGSFVIALGYQKVNNLDFFADFTGFAASPYSNGFRFVGESSNVFDTNIQQNYSLYDEGSIDNWSFAAAVDLSKNFSAGVTLNFIGGNKTYNMDYSQEDINNEYWNTYPDDFDLLTYNQNVLTDYTGFNAKIGGLFHLSDKLQLGTTITFPYSITVDEEWSDDLNLVYDTPKDSAYSLRSESGTFDYILNVPFQFGAGIAYTTDLFTISSSIDYRDWSQFKFEVPDNRSLSQDYRTLLDENTVARENYRAVLSYAFGGELNILNTGLLARAGYRYLPNPQKNLSTEFDKKFYSFGLGYTVDNRTTINFSYTLGDWNQEFEYAYSADKTAESIQTRVVQFGLNYNF